MASAPHLIDENDNRIELPFIFQICCTCEGHGKHSRGLGVYTEDDIVEPGPDFADDYFSGFYDRLCDGCDGSGKVKVADHRRMTKAQIKVLKDEQRLEREYRAEVASERRMGC